MDDREVLREALLKAEHLLREWTQGLVPVGNYSLRARTQDFFAALTPPEEPCKTCGGDGEVAVDFGLHSTGTPRIEPCPDCTPEEPHG